MNKIDIFSKNIDDVPLDVKKELKLRFHNENVRKMFELFDKKNILSVDEVIIAFYRLYEISVSRSWTLSSLNNLKCRKLIKVVSPGVYEKL